MVASCMTRSILVPLAMIFTSTLSIAAPPVAVGDENPSAFGRSMTYLGQTKLVGVGSVPPGTPCDISADGCVALNPSPELTGFSFPDLASIELPAGATHSIVLAFFHHVIQYTLHNDTGVDQPAAGFNMRMVLTFDSDALLDPALINPFTGQPFNGSFQTTFVPAEGLTLPLAAGQTIVRRTRTASGNAGIGSEFLASLGLPDKVVKRIFKEKMTVHIGVLGSARLVESINCAISMRLTGD